MVSGLDCVPPEELRAYLLGELPERAARLVAAHLEACPACEAEATGLDDASDAMIRSLCRALGSRAPNTLRDRYQLPL